MAAVRGEIGPALLSSAGPGDLEPLDPLGAAESEVQRQVVLRKIAAAAGDFADNGFAGKPRQRPRAYRAAVRLAADQLDRRCVGQLVNLALDESDAPEDYLARMFSGAPRAARAAALFDRFGATRTQDPYDAWVVEAEDSLHRLAESISGWTGLSYGRLAELREILMEQVNEMVTREQIPGPRQLGERLQRMNPGALKRAAGGDPALRDFLQSVLLNGNGTLLINNTFVEWAAVQAIRRARPALVCVAFGIRNKVKPFSSLLIYSDQEETNPIPTQADMLGSYVDLEIFYEYVWRECEKYAEYRRNTAYLFVGEGMDALLAIGPADFPLLQADKPIRLEEVFATAAQWLSI